MYSKRAAGKRGLSAISVTLGLICLLVCVFLIYRENTALQNFDTQQDFVKVFDVGQGDCTLIYSNGYSALIDTGTPESAAELCVSLQELAIKEIDVVVLTHLHDDHTGGVQRLAEVFDINNVVLPEISIESEGLSEAQLLIAKITDNGGGVYNAKQGMNFDIGEFEITVLASYGEMKNENSRSVMCAAKMDDLKFIFTGDSEADAEELLLKEGLDLKCDFFKAGHHGSSTSNTQQLLAEMRPKYTAISCGEGNMYGHPHREVLADFERYNTKIYRTDYNGDITFNVKNGRINPKTEK